MKRFLATLGGLAVLALAPGAAAQSSFTPAEGDFRASNVPVAGQVLPELVMHYRTLGQPRRGPDGRVENAILLLHGTGGSGAQFLSALFAGELFGPGQPLDTSRYYIIMPDNLGHGASSKPSDGLRVRFPEYGYADMVEAQRRLLVEGLGVDRLRLILGTSMGCMHAFVWGETHPDFADALMPLACQPTAIVGRNRLWRAMLQDAIRADPAWMGGDYQTQPLQGLRTAVDLLILAGGAPIPLQNQLDSKRVADEWLQTQIARRLPPLDANDLWYQVNASWDYDPAARLEDIRVPVTWINSADDFINPPELGLSEQFAPRIAQGRYRLIPNSPEGRGHGTHTAASFWKQDLIELLARSEGR